MADEDPEALLAKEAHVGEGRQGPAAGTGALEGVNAGAVLAELVQVRHLLGVPGKQGQVLALPGQKGARYVRSVPGLVKVHPQGIGQP